MTFGEKIRNARLTLNMSQVELAERAGVTERSVYSYENAGIYPRSGVLKQLADALNVTVAYLMDDVETDTRKNSEEELFIANAANEFGEKGAQEARELLGKASALFAGGQLNEGAKDIFFRSLMEVYMESKTEARIKFAPRKRKRRTGITGKRKE